MSKPSKFVVADAWTLICAIAMLIAFLVLPWVVSATGLRVLGGTEAVPVSVRADSLLFLIPLVGTGSLILASIGVFSPRYKRPAAWLTMLMGLGGLVYYVNFLAVNNGTLRFTGSGFGIALLACIGLVIQVAAPRPRTRLRVESDMPAGRTAERRRGNGPGGCLLAPFRAFLGPFRFGFFVLAVTFASCAICALAVPTTFQAVIDLVRNAGRQAYVRVLEVTGSPALKVVTYEADITAMTMVERDMGALSLIWGEGAEVHGTMHVALGADLMAEQVGILLCAIDTESLQTYVGRAPLAGTAFDQGEIEREAYQAFEREAARLAIEQYWDDARLRLLDNFVAWGLGLTVPETPTLTACPAAAASATAEPTPES